MDFVKIALPMYIKLGKLRSVIAIENASMEMLGSGSTSTGESSKGLNIDEEGRLRAIASAYSTGKRILGPSFTDGRESLQGTLLTALQSRDILIRISAFDFVVAGQVSHKFGKERRMQSWSGGGGKGKRA